MPTEQRRKKTSEYLNELAILLRAQFFTAEESEKLRRGAVNKLNLAIEELWAQRGAIPNLQGKARIFIAIGLLAKVMDAILTNAELRIIHQHLEEAKGVVAEVEAAPKSR